MRMKKAASLFFLITALTASVASASVQTGSIQKINLDLKYPLYTHRIRRHRKKSIRILPPGYITLNETMTTESSYLWKPSMR